MNIQLIETIFKFAGGVGMFLYGMNIMASGLQKSAGNKMKLWLAALTKNKFMAVMMGMLITAVIQSSSATTVMVVGFVNAQMMNLTQAVGIIMGANIGTTVTAWIVSMGEWSKALKPEFLAPLFIALGAFASLFAKKNRTKNIAEIFIGFGLLFVGLTFMSDVIGAYSDSVIFKNAFIILGKNPIMAILVGLVVTGILQSSSASVGILQALALNGLVSFSGTVFITLGQNIGTCVTAMLSAIGANKTAKRAAAIHLMFNTLGAIIFGILFYFVFKFKPAFADSNVTSVQISIFHTFFNISNTLILLPFSNQLVKLSGLLFDDSKEKSEAHDHIHLQYLDERLLENPLFALEASKQEILELSNFIYNNVELSVDSILTKDNTKAKQVFKNENKINAYTDAISKYLVKINGLSLNDIQSQRVSNLFHIINDLERIGDHGDNLAEISNKMIEENLYFSNESMLELKSMSDNCLLAFKHSIDIINSEDKALVKTIDDIENIVDQQEAELRERHLQRLTDGICDSRVGVSFIDALVNLERISDHTLNIANYITD